MADEFRDFGGERFQLDDGYEYFYGDWDWRPDRFPHGSAWLATPTARGSGSESLGLGLKPSEYLIGNCARDIARSNRRMVS